MLATPEIELRDRPAVVDADLDRLLAEHERHSERLEDELRGITVEQIIEREQAAGQMFGPFHRSWLLERAPEKVLRNLEKARQFPHLVGMPESQYTGPEGQASANPSNFTAVTASATETNLWTPNIWTPIPANTMLAGKAYEVSAGGIFTTTATQGVLTWTFRAGQSATPASNASFGASNAVAWAASLTGAAWFAEAKMVVRSLGLAATGATCVGHGYAFTQGAAAATATVFVFGGTVPTNVDNTGASGLILSVTISVASQSITCQWVTPVRSVN